MDSNPLRFSIAILWIAWHLDYCMASLSHRPDIRYHLVDWYQLYPVTRWRQFQSLEKDTILCHPLWIDISQSTRCTRPSALVSVVTAPYSHKTENNSPDILSKLNYWKSPLIIRAFLSELERNCDKFFISFAPLWRCQRQPKRVNWVRVRQC